MFDVRLTRADDDRCGLVVDGHGPVVGGHGQPPAHLIQAPVHQGAMVRVNFERFFYHFFFKNHSQLSAFVSFFKFSSSFLLSEIHYLPNPLITQLLYTGACSLLTREFVIKNCKKLMWVLD